MLHDLQRTKNEEFLKSLVKKKAINANNNHQEISKNENINNINNENDTDSLLRRTIYTEDMVLYAKSIINKKK